MTPLDLERGFGLPPAHQVRAADQLQKSYPRVGIQPLPAGSPGRITPDKLGIVDNSTIRFVMVGDSGGVKDAEYQQNVAQAIVEELAQDPTIAFMYHDGDVVYFNGDNDQYVPQFFEPYAHFNRPVVAIPGNHDGDVSVDDSGNHTGRQPLDTFMMNFCDVKPSIPSSDPQFEYGRHTQTQPYCYWTLNLTSLTIIGLYTNVPSGGHIDNEQAGWFAQELLNAPSQIPIMTVLHHPPYSVDAHHGGSLHMGQVIDQAAKAAQRYPDIVVSGHVHDYQRFTRFVPTGKYGQQDIPYIVLGNSGYHNLHALAGDAAPGITIQENVVFEAGDAKHWGFAVVTCSGDGSIDFEYVAVAKNGTIAPEVDIFHLKNGVVAT